MVEFKQFASLGFDSEQAALYQRFQEFLFVPSIPLGGGFRS